MKQLFNAMFYLFALLCKYISYPAGPCGAPEHKALSFHPIFDYRKQPSFSFQDLPWVSMGRFKQLSFRDWRGWRPGRKKQSRAALGQGAISPSTKPTTSLSYFVDTETPSRWEKLRYAAGKQEDPRSFKPEGWPCWLLLTSPQIHQKNVHKPITPSFTIKPVTIFPKLRHMVLRVLGCYLHFCLAKQ